MARDHARIQVAIWNPGSDFRLLPASAQHIYLLLASAPRLSYCGVIDYFPTRIAALAKGLSATKVEAAVKVLESERFVVVDRDTQELLVRSYVRHDGVLQRTNMGKAMSRALEVVVSQRLRKAILKELSRLWTADSTLAGWNGFADLNPDAFAAATGMPSPMPSAIASPIESAIPSPTPLPPTPYPPVVANSSQSQVVAPELTSDGLDRIKRATKGDEKHARKCADFVLAKAPTNVHNPVAYILKAIEDDPEAFRFKRGNPKRGEDCGVHAGEWADACRGCAADRKAAS